MWLKRRSWISQPVSMELWYYWLQWLTRDLIVDSIHLLMSFLTKMSALWGKRLRETKFRTAYVVSKILFSFRLNFAHFQILVQEREKRRRRDLSVFEWTWHVTSWGERLRSVLLGNSRTFRLWSAYESVWPCQPPPTPTCAVHQKKRFF